MTTKPLSKRKLANAYRKGAAWLEANPKKWVKGDYCIGNGRCALGAVALVLGCKSKLSGTIESFLRDAGFSIYWGAGEEAVYDVNDSCPGVEHLSDVTSYMRKTARWLEHGGG